MDDYDDDDDEQHQEKEKEVEQQQQSHAEGNGGLVLLSGPPKREQALPQQPGANDDADGIEGSQAGTPPAQEERKLPAPPSWDSKNKSRAMPLSITIGDTTEYHSNNKEIEPAENATAEDLDTANSNQQPDPNNSAVPNGPPDREDTEKKEGHHLDVDIGKLITKKTRATHPFYDW